MKNITKSIIVGALLSVSAAMLNAQTAATTPACPLGHEPGYGRSLTPEQRAEHRAVVQQLVTQLRQKQANGTITTDELSWLQRIEQRGGVCINGTPRGPGAGKGQGLGKGAGQQKRQGLRDGTGPRCADGACPGRQAGQRAGQE